MSRCGFLGGKEAIISLRNNGYRDSSMAIGELIDNSIQANARDVTIVLYTDELVVSKNNTRQVVGVAVIDNGDGMDSDLLQRSLILGEGQNRFQSKGMGKFGVGLPQSSISQAKRIDVWSWQNKHVPKHVYIDLDDELWLNDAEIKIPDEFPIPSALSQFINSDSGTVVQWTNVDKMSWRKPSTVFSKCENKIGRMYRDWLNDGSLKLRMVAVDRNGKIISKEDNYFRAVDPLFIMPDAKYDGSPEIPMFKKYVETREKKYSIIVDGVEKAVKLSMNFTIAKDSVLYDEDGQSDTRAGFKPYGKLAELCSGVSIVREGRELDLIKTWYVPNQNRPYHRWWGAEIRFNRDFDEVFGVTNNKQSAIRLTELSKMKYSELEDEFGLRDEFIDEDLCKLEKESPNDYVLFDVITTVHDIIAKMTKAVENRSKKSKREKASRHDSEGASLSKYDGVVEKRSKDENTRSVTDELVEERGDDRVPAIEATLTNNGEYTEDERQKIINDATIGHRCSIIVSPQDSSSFFTIAREDTQMIVKLNSSHLMYDQLFGVFDELLSNDSADVDSMKIGIREAFDTVQFLLTSWARMEDEDRNPKMKATYRQIRQRWGTIMEDSSPSDE